MEKVCLRSRGASLLNRVGQQSPSTGHAVVPDHLTDMILCLENSVDRVIFIASELAFFISQLV